MLYRMNNSSNSYLRTHRFDISADVQSDTGNEKEKFKEEVKARIRFLVGAELAAGSYMGYTAAADTIDGYVRSEADKGFYSLSVLKTLTTKALSEMVDAGRQINTSTKKVPILERVYGSFAALVLSKLKDRGY